jgi:hypothetical protein
VVFNTCCSCDVLVLNYVVTGDISQLGLVRTEMHVLCLLLASLYVVHPVVQMSSTIL